jgi:type II secretion system protein N
MAVAGARVHSRAPAGTPPPVAATNSPPPTPSVFVAPRLPASVAGARGAFAPEIRRVNLRDGAFHFLDEHGRPVATFTGVDFRSNFRNATALRGTITIAKTSLRDSFFLEKLKSPLQYDPSILDFSHISAQAAGGEITGRFSMRPQEQESPFTARVQFHDLQADQLVTEAGGPKGMIKGRLEGMLEGRGHTADPNALTGQGEIFLRDGEVQQYSLLVALGQILQIEELTQLRLDEAHVKYHLTPGLITIDDLVLRSPNIRLSATGTITFSGKLRLESQLALNQKIRGQLFRAIRNNFQPSGEAGYAAIAFQIRGTLGHPKTNLMDRLVGEDLKDLGSVLNSLFGGGKSERKKKKKQHAVERTSAETPAPASAPPIPLPEATATP